MCIYRILVITMGTVHITSFPVGINTWKPGVTQEATNLVFYK